MTAEVIQDPFLVWGWRIPFLLSVVMVLVGLSVRLRIEETPVFAKALAHNERVKAPIGEVFKRNRWEIVMGTFIMLATWILSCAIAGEGAGA